MPNRPNRRTAFIERMQKAQHDVWVTADFTDLVNYSTASMALRRLRDADVTKSIGFGLYRYMRENPLVPGLDAPAADWDILNAISRRDGSRWVYSPAIASIRLGGLTTQTEGATVSVLTDSRLGEREAYDARKAGISQPKQGRIVTIDETNFNFIPAKPQDLFWAGRPAATVVQALTHELEVVRGQKDRIAAVISRHVVDNPEIRNDLLSGWALLPNELQSFLRPIVYLEERLHPVHDIEDQYDGPDIVPGRKR